MKFVVTRKGLGLMMTVSWKTLKIEYLYLDRMRNDTREIFESQWQYETPQQRTIDEDFLSENHWLETTTSIGKNKRCFEEGQAYIEWQFNDAISFVFWTCWQSFSGLTNSKITKKKMFLKEFALANYPPSPPPPKIPFIDNMPIFIHKYIKWIVNVESDNNYNFRAVSALISKGEDNHTLVHRQLIHELRIHKKSYTRIYENK